MRARRIAAAATALTVAVGLSACGGSGESGGGSSGGDKPYVAIVSKGFQHQFWQAVKEGAEEEAKKQGVRMSFVGPDTETDVEQQVQMLTNAMAKQPDVLALAALDSKAVAPLMQQAQSQDIPVVAFDSGVDSDVPVTTAATDNKAAAALAAKHMAKLLDGKGKVGLVVHDQTSRSGIDRRDGFVEWMEGNAPDIQLLEPRYGAGDQAKSADITKAMLAANPDLDGIFGANEGSAVGVIKGVQESGNEDVTVVGFDSGQAQIDAIKDGTMAGAITQNPVGMGREVIKSAVKAMEDKKLPRVIDTGYYWYDKKNLDDPKIQEVLYR